MKDDKAPFKLPLRARGTDTYTDQTRIEDGEGNFFGHFPRAYAAYIVQAVNAHADLLAALEVVCAWTEPGTEGCYCGTVNKVARAAIAKAKENK